MKLIVDIPDEDCAFYISMYNGIPLEEELEKIKEEIKPLPITDTAIRLVSNIIDNHISELEGENNG